MYSVFKKVWRCFNSAKTGNNSFPHIKMGTWWVVKHLLITDSLCRWVSAKIISGMLLLWYKAAIANYWQARPPQWQPHQQCAATATATATFSSAKSRQGLGLGGLASRVGPVIYFFLNVRQNCSIEVWKTVCFHFLSFEKTNLIYVHNISFQIPSL